MIRPLYIWYKKNYVITEKKEIMTLFSDTEYAKLLIIIYLRALFYRCSTIRVKIRAIIH